MSRRGWGVTAVIAVALWGCSGARTKAPLEPLAGEGGCKAIETFFETDLEGYQNAVDQAAKEYQEEQWRAETADPKANEARLSALFARYQEVTYDKELVLLVRAMDESAKSLGAESCPAKARLSRARRLLEAAVLTDPAVIRKEKENQDKQDALIRSSNAFRLTVEGEKEPVSKAIYSKKLGATADRGQREKLFREHNAKRAAKWLEWGFRDLVKSRNEEAKLAGFPSYVEYRFHRNGLDLAGYRQMVKEVREKLAPKMRAEIRRQGKQAGIARIEPWDLRYLRDKSASGEIDGLIASLPEMAALDIARRFYASLGISIDDYGFTMDLLPRPGKNTHAFAMSVVFPRVDANGKRMGTPKPDIRFLANLRKPVRWSDVGTIIHELGHAIHAAEVRQPVGVFRSTESVPTEAIAMALERVADSPVFVKEVLGEVAKVDSAKAEAAVRNHDRAVKVEQAYSLLRQMFFSEFEAALYANPDGNLAETWSKLHRDYWGVDVPVELADWDVEHFAMAPVYVQNYALGILMVEQIVTALQAELGPDPRSPKLGEKLKLEYFGPGQEYDYRALTKRLTGSELSAAAALKLL